MIVKLKDISQDGLEINKTIPADEIGLTDEEFAYKEPLKIDAFLEKADDAVIATVKVDGSYEFTCGRCLALAQHKRRDQFNLVFEIDKTTEIINLGEDIRQELVIALTSLILCKEDCKGICPNCGVDFNQNDCQCSQEKVKKDRIKINVQR